MEKKQNNIDNNKIKFYVTDEVLELLFNFLSQENRLSKLKKEIQEITEDGKNKDKTQHPKEYFNIINEKIANIETIINKDYNSLQSEDKTALAEFLYQLEDLGEDKKFCPEKKTQEDSKFKLKNIITQLHAIKTLTLPVLEDCTYHYDRDNANKTTKINLVQDFNLVEKQKTNSAYSFINFFPFNTFKTEQDAIKFHYKIMAKNYFTYLKDCIDENPNKFFVCYKPGVSWFGDHTDDIEKIFKEEFDKLEGTYKDRILFCVNSNTIDKKHDKGFKYDYKANDLREMYPENKFIKTLKDTDIAYINGVARDPWAKIGDEGREQANCESFTGGSTDSMFVKSSNEVEILYGVEIKRGLQKDKRTLQNLKAQKPKIICKDINYKNIQNNNQLSQTDDMYKDKETVCCCNII